MSLSAAEILEIHHAINLYGHALDERRWSDLDLIFTQDVVFDFSDLGLPVLNGVEAVRQLFAGYASHPLAHHGTNIVVTAEGGEALASSKGLMLLPNGTLSSWVYADRLRKDGGAWRIFHRVGRRVGQKS